MNLSVTVRLDDYELERIYNAYKNQLDYEDVECFIDDLIDGDAPMLPRELRQLAEDSIGEIASRYREAMDNDDHWNYVLEDVVRQWVREQKGDQKE